MKTFPLIALGALAFAALPASAGDCSSSAKATSAEEVTYTPASYSDEKASGEYEKKAKLNIVETAQEAGSFNTLLAAAEAAGLVGALTGEGPLTVFAPTDEAFAALPEGTVESLLLPENKDQLAGILKYHVIAGAKIKSKNLAGSVTEAETLNGIVVVDGTDGVKVGPATVITADIKASNGIIHVIDQVLIPTS